MPNGFGYNPMFAGAMACPTCGYAPTAAGIGTGYPYSFQYGWGFPYSYTPGFGPFLGGPPTWGGTFPGMYGPGMYPGAGMYPGRGWTFAESWPSDEQIREAIFDAMDADPVIPYDSDINVEVTGGVVTLSGTVPNKRIKHAIGDDTWWIPGVWDVNNNLQIVRRRERAPRAQAPAEAAAPTKETKKK